MPQEPTVLNLRLPLLLALPLLAPSAGADVVSGLLLDSNGQPVAGANISAKNSGGDDVTVLNGSSNALGQFAFTVPSGILDVTFTPPPPPASTALPIEVEDVIVFGATNMGTVVAPAGVSVSGVVRNSIGIPVEGVDIDVVDLTTGDKLDLSNDQTNAFGQYAVPCPIGPVALQFKATNASIPNLVSQELELTLTTSLVLADLLLENGVHVIGTVVGPGGGPLNNIDVDAQDSITGEKIYTPGDNTNSAGQYDIVVPTGTFDFDYCPPSGVLLTSAEILKVNIAGPTNLGSVQLLNGVVLSGQILGPDGQPYAGADIDLEDPVSGQDFPLCGDSANSNGVYSLVVPTGTWNVIFEPKGFSEPIGADVNASVVINSNAVLNGSLPNCPFGTTYGSGTGGTGGLVPALASAGGAPRVGNSDYAFALSNALPNTPVILGLSPNQSGLPLFGGTVLVDLLSVVSLGGFSSPSGTANLPFPVAITSNFVGVTIHSQYFVIDFGAPEFIAMSNGLSTTFCD